LIVHTLCVPVNLFICVTSVSERRSHALANSHKQSAYKIGTLEYHCEKVKSESSFKRTTESSWLLLSLPVMLATSLKQYSSLAFTRDELKVIIVWCAVMLLNYAIYWYSL